MKISNSATNKYLTCAKSYELHYKQRIRPNWTSSALLFGDAIDKGLNALLLKTGNPFDVFLKGWTNGLINKIPVYLPTSEKLLYAVKDYNPDLLTKEDNEDVDNRIKEGTIQSFDHKELAAKKAKNLSLEEKKFFNYINWLCMKNKARYMLEGYEKEVLPRIKKVHAIQKEIKSDNGAGDSLNGFIDLIADIDDHGTVILDHKTSAMHYEPDQAAKSSQLALYLNMEGANYNTRLVGFIVMKKQLAMNRTKVCKSCGHVGEGSHKTCNNTINGKRCGGEWSETVSPKAEFQVIINEMPTHFEEMTMNNIDDVASAIKQEVFPRNLSACDLQFGSPCIYRNLCHNGSMHGLVEEKE